MEENVRKWIIQIGEFKKGEIDLSRDEDLSIAIMNMISLEEHFYFTAMKTDNPKYLEMLNSVREIRKKMLAKIVTNPEGEEWCISKHLLASSMRLIETGTKELAKKNEKEAHEFFTDAFSLYSLFFAINLKLADTKALDAEFAQNEKKNGLLDHFSVMVKKIVDCCRE